MRKLIKIGNVILIATTCFVLTFCANPVSPTGGPQDTKPPKMLSASPPLFTRNFSEKKVRIYFDEYVEVKDLSNQLIVSPPMKKNPEVKIKGKSIIIEFDEELLAETTYNIFFGNSIVDITEGNPLSNFQYIFSTGNILDSLSIKGNIYNAFDNSAPEITNVMLYLDNNDTLVFDSLPYFIKPYFMTKTNENGDFTLNNLPGKNSNYLLCMM
ncbi:MAG: Ig-like domain-containing protein [Bacteroidales bacterium]